MCRSRFTRTADSTAAPASSEATCAMSVRNGTTGSRRSACAAPPDAIVIAIGTMTAIGIMTRDGARAGDPDPAPRWTDQQAEAMVARAYRTLLGREPDPAARSWVDQVKSNHWSEQQLKDEIRKSREYREKHPR